MRTIQGPSTPAQKRTHSQAADNSEITGSPAPKRVREGKSALIDLSGGTIEVAVSDGEIFHLHKNLICKASPLFNRATKPEWAGSVPKPVELSDVPPSVFKVYMAFLYTKAVDGMRDADSSWSLLASAYVLGELLMDPKFQQAIIDEMICEIKDTEDFPRVQDINTIYNGTMPDSPVRRLIVDLCASRATSQTFKKDDDGVAQLHAEFLQDALQAVLSHRPLINKGKKNEPSVMKNSGQYIVKIPKA